MSTNFYKEHIKVEKSNNNFKDRIENTGNMIDDSSTIGKNELNIPTIGLGQTQVKLYRSADDVRTGMKTNINNYYTDTQIENSPSASTLKDEYNNINTIHDYHKFQMDKKISRSKNNQLTKDESKDFRFLNPMDSVYDPNEIYDKINLGSDKKQSYHDLFYILIQSRFN